MSRKISYQNAALVAGAASLALVSFYWLRKVESNEGCCPKGSIPDVPGPDLCALGTTKTVSFPDSSRPPMDVYITGAANKNSNRAVIVCTDIFGIDGGQKKQVCDALAARLGCVVVMPDFFRGDACTPEIFKAGFVPWAQQWQPEGVVADVARVHEHLLAGASFVGVAGFCWGAWAALQAAAAGHATAVVFAHPSHRKMCANVVKQDCDELLLQALGAAKEGGRPALRAALLLPAGNDDPAHKAGGADEATLTKSGCEVGIREFPEMAHGWILRGDVKLPVVSRDVGLAVDLIVDFFDRKLM
mmetsp:Transcript_28026/g.47406  ORF Transcript_28026/g.47406 Transcript_28026/m.47406 type:complete len:302 (+) Transcript_28026:355-1260(+)